jgi:hypothetical protein
MFLCVIASTELYAAKKCLLRLGGAELNDNEEVQGIMT